MRYNNLLESINTKLVSDEIVSRRYSLSELISESYKLCYSCDEGTNLKKVAEAHLEDVRSNPKDIDRLSRQLCIITALSESKGIRDKDILIDTTKRLSERSIAKKNVKDKKVEETYRPTSKLHVNEEDNPELTDEEVEELAKHLDSIRKERKSTTPAKKEVTEDATPRKGIRCTTHRSSTSVDECDSSKKEVDESVDDTAAGYRVYQCYMDIAVPADKDFYSLGVSAQTKNRGLYDAISEALDSQGLEMAGDEIGLEVEVTDTYVNNDYEFFTESKKKDLDESGHGSGEMTTHEMRNISTTLRMLAEELENAGKESIYLASNTYGLRAPYVATYEGFLELSSDAVDMYVNGDEYYESKKVNGKRVTESYRGLSEFSKNSANKPFYKTFKKMHESLKEGKALTRQESMNLYKAANSALTQLSVELEHNPKFLKTFSECTTLLSADVSKLLESMKNGKAPSKNTMKSLSKFSEALLTEGHSEEWIKDIALDYMYGEDRDMDNSKYSEVEIKKALDYYFKKHPDERSPYSESKKVTEAFPSRYNVIDDPSDKLAGDYSLNGMPSIIRKIGDDKYYIHDEHGNYDGITADAVRKYLKKSGASLENKYPYTDDDLSDSKKVDERSNGSVEDYLKQMKSAKGKSEVEKIVRSAKGNPNADEAYKKWKELNESEDDELINSLINQYNKKAPMTKGAIYDEILKQYGNKVASAVSKACGDDPKINEAEDDEDGEDIDVEDTEETEDDDFVGDDEGDVQSSEADDFDQEYADARVEMHKDMVEKHGDSEDPDVQEKIAQDAEEVTSLPGISDEQVAEINGQGEDPEEGESEEEEAPEEDDGEVTDDELEELKKHLKEMRAAKKKGI